MKIIWEDSDTKDKASELSYWIFDGLLRTIREDEDIDNIGWLAYWVDIIQQIDKDFKSLPTEKEWLNGIREREI